MKPYPRIRKTIKWGGFALFLWCGAVCLITFPHEHMIWFYQSRTGNRTSFLAYVPFWTPTVVLGVVTATAWRFDTAAHRRARLDLCPKCNYDRTGLAKGAACPECGSGETIG